MTGHIVFSAIALVVTALTRVFGDGPSPRSPLFNKREQEFIPYWREELGERE